MDKTELIQYVGEAGNKQVSRETYQMSGGDQCYEEKWTKVKQQRVTECGGEGGAAGAHCR